jgi:hypothetical protein
MYIPNMKLLKRLNMTGIRRRIAHPLAAMGVIYAACATIVAPVAHAGPLLYSIVFTTSFGPAPTGGSFYYDASAPIAVAFSDFIVSWDGLQIDLTASANNPEIGAPDGVCLVNDAFEFLNTGSACTLHASGYPGWE